MKLFRNVLLCGVLLALILLLVKCVLLLHAVHMVVVVLPQTVEREMRMLASMADAQIAAAREDLRSEVAGVRKTLQQESRAWRQMVAIESRYLSTTADTRLQQLQVMIDAHLANTLLAVNRLRDDVKPVLSQTDELLAHTTGTVADLHPQLLGLIAASKMSAGHTAQTMRTVNTEIPAITKNVQIATNYAGETAKNLERITRPDRWPVKVLKLVGPFVTGWIFGRVKSTLE